MITLYPHQETVIEQLRDGFKQGYRRQMLAMATGAGKTVVASHMIRTAHEKSKRSWFVVDRIELVRQAARHLESIGLRVGIAQGSNTNFSDRDDCVVGTIQSLRARMNWRVQMPDFIVIDEAHILHKSHIALMDKLGAVPVVGLSATPLRPDLGKHFSNLVRGPSIAWLIENGFLTPAKAFCPSEKALEKALENVHIRRGDFVESELGQAMNSKELIGDIIGTWQRLGEDRQTLCFACDIAHSKAIAEEFQMAGVSVAHLDAYTRDDARTKIVDAFKAGEIRILTSVNVLGIGFDVPQASCAILARPTVSEALHVQQMGRVIRSCEGKHDAMILDHAGNTLRFGLPQDFAIPDLGTGEHNSGAKAKKQKKLQTCSECGFVMEPGQMTCGNCGIDRQVRNSEVSYVDAELIEYGSIADQKTGYTPDVKREWYLGLRWYAQTKGYQPGWSYFKYQEKFKAKPPFKWRSLDPIPPTPEISRWIKSQNIRFAKSKQRYGQS